MCLILLAWHVHPNYPLVVAANRDEFFARPSAAADFWPDHPQVLAGRDLEGGGTWFGITRQGRFAGLTNYRDPADQRPDAPSRGHLVADFLSGDMAAPDFQARLESQGHLYNGYNLLFGNLTALHYQSNRGGPARRLPAGLYGLSNHLLDTPWPKVAAGKSRLQRALATLPDQQMLLELLMDQHISPDHALPNTGVSLDWERLLSAAFVRSPAYGTRSSSLLTVDAQGGLRFTEIQFDTQGKASGERHHTLTLSPSD